MLWKILDIKVEEALKSWSQKVTYVEKYVETFSRLSFKWTQILSESTWAETVKKNNLTYRNFSWHAFKLTQRLS